jgi:hypothetical protein
LYGGLADGIIQEVELGGGDPGNPDNWSWFGGFDPDNPGVAESTNIYDPKYKTPLLDELSIAFEREIITDFAIRLEGFYKKLHRFSLDRGILPDGTLDSQDNYFYEGTEPITGSDYYGRYVRPIGSYRTNYVDGTLSGENLTGATQMRQSYNRYVAGEIVLKKRLSHNWMLDGSVTLSSWKYFAKGNEGVWPYDPTNFDFYDGGVVAPQSGGSGISAVWVNARWMAKLAGLYQFPYGIAGSFAFQAREGYVTPPFVQVYRTRIGWTNINANAEGEIGKFGDRRLPNFYELSLRIEKTFNVSEKLRFTVAGDCFNVFNAATGLEQLLDLTSSSFGQTRRILNPRVFRVGVRAEF